MSPMPIAARPIEIMQEAPFYVATTGIGGRPQCSLKYNDTFLVMDNYCDIHFADLFEVRGLRRERRGIATRSLLKGHRVLLNYQGLDGITRHTAISFDPPPARLSGSEAHYECVLAPGDITRVFIAVGCN